MPTAQSTPRRLATCDEIQALDRLSVCRFQPSRSDKRFVLSLHEAMVKALNGDEPFLITEAQAGTIERLHHRYRRQTLGVKS